MHTVSTNQQVFSKLLLFAGRTASVIESEALWVFTAGSGLLMCLSCVCVRVCYSLDRVFPGTPVPLIQLLHVQSELCQAELIDG